MPSKKKQVIRGPTFIILRVVDIEVRNKPDMSYADSLKGLFDVFGINDFPSSQDNKSAKAK